MPVVLGSVVAFGLLLALIVQRAGATAAAGCVSPCCDPTAALPGNDCAADTCAFLQGCLMSSDFIAAAAQQAGFTGQDLITAVAIALAESGGNPNVYNPETAAAGGTPEGQGSYGLWQIYLKAHPEFAATDLTDPNQNANAAFYIYSNAGSSFQPWSTFTNRSYMSHIDDATQRVSA